MQIAEHILAIRGPKALGKRPSPDAVGPVLQLIGAAVRESISMGFRNTSLMRGRRPDWLTSASDIRFTGVSQGDNDATRLHFEAPRFGDAAEDLYRQGQFFETRPSKRDTGFDLLGDVLSDIETQARDSMRFDSRLLKRIKRFEGLASKSGVDSICFYGDRLSKDHPPTLDERVSELAASLYHETPSPKRARIAGKLDMIRASDNVFELIISRDVKVRGVWTGGEMGLLSDLFEKDVVVEGQAIFRVSGLLLRVDAEAIRMAGETDRFFWKVPRPASGTTERRYLLQPQTETTGVNAVFNKWPGDETEEEILAALKEMG